ncbi:MAG: FGGY-family carbohydrate kinase [Geopsychrobacter sp.]|nr:FGGY-family carbohydrate kinase [Geopsychrobacter sp.]
MSAALQPELLLAIDVGTQSIRALLFDLRGRLVARVTSPIEAYFSTHPGWAEQHPDYYWQQLCATVQRLWLKDASFKPAVVGVTLTTQRATLVNVDRNGHPLRPAILYLDQRTTTQLPRLRRRHRLLFKLLRLEKTIRDLQAQAEINWIRAEQPQIWAQTHKVLFLSGYLNFRLTGRYADSSAAQVGYLPFDYRRQCWAESGNWKWQALPLAKEQLPELLPPGTLLGQVTASAAQQTGLPVSLPVVSAAADKACEVLGSGGTNLQIGSISYGTETTINTTSKRYIEPIPPFPAYPSAIPGHYNLEILHNRGFWLVSWFIREFGNREQLQAEQEGLSPEQIFDRLITDIPPGAMGLMVQPTWGPGLRNPGPEAKGAMLGFGDVHTRGHVYRAILEGLGYALREGKERLEARSKVRMQELRASGGGAQSQQMLQITADICNLPVRIPSTHETSGLGAALLASVGLGLHGDFSSALGEMVRVRDAVEPQQEQVELYAELYHAVYQRLYRRVRPLYLAINRITGYPGLG